MNKGTLQISRHFRCRDRFDGLYDARTELVFEWKSVGAEVEKI